MYSSAWGIGGEILPPFPQFAGDNKRQEATAMAVDSSGNVIVSGYRNIAGDTNDDIYTVKFKADGTGMAWAPKALDVAGGSDRATAVAVDYSGDIIVAAFVTTGGQRDILTVKYSGATGDELWRATYNGAAGGHDVPVAITVDDRDNVYVAGYTQNSAADEDYLLFKYSKSGANPDGSPIWEAQYDGPGHGTDRVTAIAVGAGSVAVTGHSWNGTDFDSATRKYSDAGGLTWDKRVSSPGQQPDWGKALVIDALGDVIVTGYVTTQGTDTNKDITTVKYRDPAVGTVPTVVWTATHAGTFDDEPVAVTAVGADVFVAGTTMTLTGNRDIILIKYGDPPTGTIPLNPWSKIFNSAGGEIDEAVAMAADNAGNLYITGTLSTGIVNTQTVKFRQSDGVVLWHKLYENPSGKNNRPVGVGISGSDDVYVAGSIDRTSAFDMDYYVFRHDPGLINPPTGLTSGNLVKQVNKYSVTLNWSDNATNEDSYIVERKVGAGSFAALPALGANVTSFIDNDLDEWTHYTYRVKARNTANGDSHYSNEVQVFALIVAPMPPVWTYSYNGRFDADDMATAIAVGPDNNPVVTGYSIDYAPGYSSGTYSTDFLTIKLDRTNAGPGAGPGLGVLWQDQHEGGFNQEDDAKGVAVDGNNRVIITGNSFQDVGGPDNVNSIVTIKYPAAGPPHLWHAQYNGPVAIDDRVRAIASSSDGLASIAVIGHGKNSSQATANEDIYLVKYAADPAIDQYGKAIPDWVAQPLDWHLGNDYPSAVIYDKDGNIFVAGYLETALDSMSYRSFVAKYCGKANSPSCEGALPGQQIWSHIRDDIQSDNQVRTLTVDTDGNLYAAGFVRTTDSGKDALIVKYAGTRKTPAEQLLWTKTYRSPVYLPGDDEVTAIKFDPVDNRLVVAANSDVALNDSDVTIISYGAATGNVLWQKSVPSTGADEVVYDMVLDVSGNIFAVGSTTGADLNTNSLTVKFDYDGNLLGRTVYDKSGSFDESSTATVNSLGELFVAGYATNASTGPSGANADYLVYKVTGVALQAPSPFTVTQNYRSAILSWGDNTAVESGYELDRKNGACPADVRTDDPLNPWTAVAGSPFAPNTITHTDSGLASGDEYCYRLRAYTNLGEVTRWVPRGTVMQEPQPPTSFTATAQDTTTIRLAWGDATTNEDGFFIERCAGTACTFATSDPGYASFTAAAGATSYADSTVCSGTAYRYRIQAFRTNDWRTAFSLLPVEVSPVVVTPPTSLVATPLNEVQVSVSWVNPNPDADGYRIWRCQDAGAVPCTDFGVNPLVTLEAGRSLYVDNTFTSDATFRYRIASFKQTATCNWNSDQSVASAGAKTTTANLTLSSSGVTTTQAVLSWTGTVATETGFRLERCLMSSCTADTDFTVMPAIAANASSYTDSNLCSGTGYGYRVKAVNEGLPQGGTGAWTKRIPLTINNFAPDKVVRLVLNLQPGMKADFSDIRFYDEMAKLALPYWIEPFTGQPAAVVVWLKLGNRETSLYYGNSMASSASSATAVFGNGLVGYWPFREAAGTLTGTTADVSGNNLNATLAGMISSYGIVAAGKYGNGLSMAPNGAVTVADVTNSPLDITGSLTVEFWYQYQKSMDWARIVSKSANGGNEPWDLYHIYLDNNPGNQRAYFRVVSNNGQPYQALASPASPQLVPGTWYHLVGRYNKTTGRISLFVNGVEYANTGTPLTIGVNNEAFGIGTMGSITWNHALGVLDEVRLYSQALSDQEIASRYEAVMPTVTVEQAPVDGPFTFNTWTSGYSTPQPVHTLTTPVLAAPSSVTVSWVSESQLKVDWQYQDGEQTAFEVDRCQGASCIRVKDATAAERSFVDSDLLHNTSYHYLVRAVKSATCRTVSADKVSAPQVTTLKAPEMTPVPVVNIWTNCEDLRLFDDAGVTPIPFWLDKCNSAATTLWLKFSSLPSGPTALKLYYGNPLASSVAADPRTIFSFYDGFDGAAIDETLWTINNAAGWSVANGQLRGTNNSGRLSSKKIFLDGFIQEVKAKTTTRAESGQTMAGFSSYPASSSMQGWLDHPGTLFYRLYNQWYPSVSELPLNVNYLYRVENMTPTTTRLSITNYDTNTPVVDTGSISTTGLGQYIQLGMRYDASYTGYPYLAEWDWVRVRRYLDSSLVPTVVLGTEEGGPFAGMTDWRSRRQVTINNPGAALAYTSPDGYQLGIVVDSTPLASDRITVSWKDTTASEEQFVIERCLGTAATCIPGQFAVDKTVTVAAVSGMGTTLSLTDREVAKNSSYCYRVRATRSSTWLTTPDSAIACGQTSPLPNPPLLTADPHESRIDITWNTAEYIGENGFELDRCTVVAPALDCDFSGGSDAGFPKMLGPNTGSYVDNAVCGTYKYRLRSVKLGVPSWPSWSNEVIAATGQPAAPTELTLVPGSDVQTTVKWTDRTGDESGFEVWRCAGVDCDFSNPTIIQAGASAGTGAVVTLQDTMGLSPGTYRYQVRAIKSGSACGWPSQFSAPSANFIVAAAIPSGVAAVADSTTQATVRWTDTALSESGFTIQRCTDAAVLTPCTDFSLIGVTAANALSFPDPGVCFGSTYRYRVGSGSSGLQLSQPGGGCWMGRAPLQIATFQANYLTRFTVARDPDMKPDYSDLRFYDSTARAELPYWIEQADGSGATVWIKTGANNTIYLYFGNPSATAASSQAAVFGAGLMGYWPFNEAAGQTIGNVSDVSSLGNNVLMNNFSLPYGVVSGGKYGNALSLNGSAFASLATPNIPAGTVASVEAWIYPTAPMADFAGIVSWGPRTCNGNGINAAVMANGQLRLATYCNAFQSGAAINYNAWNHVVYVLNGQTATIYQNGVKMTGSLPYMPNLTSIDLSIGTSGATANTQHFNGMIDELRLYNRALTDADVAARYAVTLPTVTLGGIEKGGGCLNAYPAVFSAPAAVVIPGIGNLLADSDVETGVGSAYGWKNDIISGATVDPSTSHSGRSSLKLAAAGSVVGATQTVTVNPGGTYLLSGYVKTNLPNAGTRAQCDVQGVGIDTAGLLVATVGVQDWTYKTETVTIPGGTTSVNIRCFIDGYTYGTAWFDMVQFEPQQILKIAAARLSEGMIRLDWKETLKDESGYRVKRCAWGAGDTSCTTYVQLGADLEANSSSYVDMSVEPNKKYSYQLEAFKSTGCAWPQIVSNVVTETATMGTLGKPVALALDTTRMQVSWSSDFTAETGYTLLRSTSGDGGQTWSAFGALAAKAGPGATSLVDDTVCAGVQNRYKVQAFKDGLANSGGNCWTRKKQVTVGNHAPAYQLRLVVDNDADMKADYSDLRFYDQGLSLELPYWIEKSDTQSAIVWVKSSGSAILTMYYGNPAALAVSNPVRVFDFFEGFDGTTINTARWREVDAAANYVTQNNELIIAPGYRDLGIYSIANFPRPFVLEAQGTLTDPGYGSFLGLQRVYDGLVSGWYAAHAFKVQGDVRAVGPEQSELWVSGGPITANATYLYRIDLMPTGARYAVAPFGSSPTIFATNTTVTTDPLKISLNTDYGGMRYDNLRIRKFAAREPTYSIGPEEVLASCPTFGGQWVSPESVASDAVATPVPLAPTLSVVSTTDRAMAISWVPKTTDQSGFRLERCQAVGVDSCQPVDVGLTFGAATTSFGENNVTPSSRYCYRVVPYKAAACTTVWDTLGSEVVCATALAQQASDLSVRTISSRALELTWTDNAQDEDGYEIETLVARAVSANNPGDQGVWALVAKVNANVVTYLHAHGLEPNRTYWYRVRPFRGAYGSPYTVPAAGTTQRKSEDLPNSCP